MDDTTPKEPPTPEELARARTEKKLAIRALLRTSVPPRIEVLKRLPFEVVLHRHERANRDLKRHMQSGLMGRSKRQTADAFQAFVEAIATSAFGSNGVTILDELFLDVHPEVEAAKQRGRVLSLDGLLGFLGALTGSASRPADQPVLVAGRPPELRDDVPEDVLARRRAKFGTD